MPLPEMGCLQQGVASFLCSRWTFNSVTALTTFSFLCLSEQSKEARREMGRAERRGSSRRTCASFTASLGGFSVARAP